MKLPPVVEVEWIDSCAGPGWRSPNEAADWIKDIQTYFSAGYLISKTKEEVTIATGISTRSGRTHDLFQIPRACVLKIKKVK